MKSTLLPLLSAAIALAGFGPSVRVDHQNAPAGIYFVRFSANGETASRRVTLVR